MGILQLPMQVPGMVGVLPNQKFMLTTDNYATVTAAGYLNQVSLEANPVSSTDVLQVMYSFNQQTGVGSFGIFTVGISGGTITLTSWSNPGEVVLPTRANYLAHFTNTTGTISGDDASVINGGDVQSGYANSSSNGTFTAVSRVASGGYLRLAVTTNGSGNFNTTITNAAAVAQSQVITIPDVGNAVGEFLVGATATPFVSGNFPVASGTAGLMVDSGVAAANLMKINTVNTMTGVGSIILPKVNGTEAANAVTASGVAGVITTSALTTAGAANYAITWTNTKITATSVIHLSVQGGSNNATQNISFTVVPGSGSATLTIFNNTAATALNGTLLIGYTVF